MSSDLLKEFGDLHENPWSSEGTKRHLISNEDDFGEFEQPEEQAKHAFPHERSIDNPSALHARSEEILAQEDDEEDFADEDWGETQQSNLDWEWQAPVPLPSERVDRSKRTSDDVLFDAEAEDAPKSRNLAALKIQDDDFAAWEPANTSEDVHRIQPLAPALRSEARLEAPAGPARASNNEPPPTNVPPPSLLLSLGDSLLKKLMRLSGQSANGMSQEPGGTSVDEGWSDLRAIGRILAGRKSRWNRDKFLSQSMRIGQAGTQGGMKLTKVDKTENRREDQEAAELLKTWKQHAGALRVRLAQGKTSQMPELAASMPVRVAKPGEGALTAPKPCFLCGLKREERVLKVDADVEDGFGLWWVEHWGHRDCVHFWNRHRKALPQR